MTYILQLDRPYARPLLVLEEESAVEIMTHDGKTFRILAVGPTTDIRVGDRLFLVALPGASDANIAASELKCEAQIRMNAEESRACGMRAEFIVNGRARCVKHREGDEG